jgi:hypothetical protein
MVIGSLARGLAWLAAVAAFGCGGSGSNSSTNSGANPFVGTFTGTYAGVFTITSPEAQPQGSVAETGTFVFTAPTDTTIEVTATFAGTNGVSGTCTATADRNGDTASSDPTTQACSYSVTGGMQTNENSSSFSVSGDTVIDVLTGTFTGTNASGNYGGTFSGTWTLTPQ